MDAEHEYLSGQQCRDIGIIEARVVKQIQTLRAGTDRRFLRQLNLTSQQVARARDEATNSLVTNCVKLMIAEQMLEETGTFPFAEYQRRCVRAVRYVNARS